MSSPSQSAMALSETASRLVCVRLRAPVADRPCGLGVMLVDQRSNLGPQDPAQIFAGVSTKDAKTCDAAGGDSRHRALDAMRTCEGLEELAV